MTIIKDNLIEFESKVIKRFVIKNKQERYIQFIQNQKNRGRFTGQLAHFNDLKFELFEEVVGDEKSIILAKLASVGKYKDCYLISENPELDQKFMEIDTALNEVIGFGMGTLIIFGDAEMLYYEAEGPKDRWIAKTIHKLH
jgi:hypothetical protein